MQDVFFILQLQPTMTTTFPYRAGHFSAHINFNSSSYGACKRKTRKTIQKIQDKLRELQTCTKLQSTLMLHTSMMKDDLKYLADFSIQLNKLLYTSEQMRYLATELLNNNPKSYAMTPGQLNEINKLKHSSSALPECENYSSNVSELINDIRTQLPLCRKKQKKNYHRIYDCKKKILQYENKVFLLSHYQSDDLLSLPPEIWLHIFKYLIVYPTRFSYKEAISFHECTTNIKLTCSKFNTYMSHLHTVWPHLSVYNALVNQWKYITPHDMCEDVSLYHPIRMNDCSLLNSIAYSLINYIFSVDELDNPDKILFTKEFNNTGYIYTHTADNLCIKLRKSLQDYCGNEVYIVHKKCVMLFEQLFGDSFLYVYLRLHNSCIFHIDPHFTCTFYYTKLKTGFTDCPKGLLWHPAIKSIILAHFPNARI